MQIKMDSLIITDYCSIDDNKYKFIKEISEDKLVRQYASNTMDEWLEDSEGLNKLCVGPAYIIEDQNKQIGFIRISSLKDLSIYLDYGVHKDYRNKHYGTKILTETSNCIFNQISMINTINLLINSENKHSIKCAINSGYKLIEESQSSKGLIKKYSLERSK